ncbi:MAG: DUF1326 domain-containing protein [Deltaproteobacteria bacterium]|nr:DUF1326 domain-containing protein [Deltaproteobacteria bacterium]
MSTQRGKLYTFGQRRLPMAEKWSIAGEYFESCNCDLICACLVQAPTPRDRCDAALAFHVNNGTYGQTSIDNLNAVWIISFPGPGKMRNGNWTCAVYVDETGTKEQQEALGKIFSGQAGGTPGAVYAGLVSKFLGVKAAPISFQIHNNERKLTIPNILEIDIAAVMGGNGKEPLWATNAAHPVSSKLALAASRTYSYNDHNLSWSTSGTNGHFAPFTWAA